MTTGEGATAVEDRHPPTTTTGGAKESGAFTAKVAVGPVEINGIAFVLPVFATTLMSVCEDHPAWFGAHADGSVIVGRIFRVPVPMPSAPHAAYVRI